WISQISRGALTPGFRRTNRGLAPAANPKSGSLQPDRIACAKNIARPRVGRAGRAAAVGSVIQVEAAQRSVAVAGGLVAGERIADAKYLHPVDQVVFGDIARDSARIAFQVHADNVVAIGRIAGNRVAGSAADAETAAFQSGICGVPFDGHIVAEDFHSQEEV